MKNRELFDPEPDKKRNIIIGIDPGPTTSGQVVVDGSVFPPDILESNGETLDKDLVCTKHDAQVVVSEWLVSYATAVGFSVLDTARLVGRIEERADSKSMEFYKLTRPEVGLEITGSNRSKKGQVNEAVRELYRKHRPETLGGGKKPAVGTKKFPGPLYIVKSHAWDALAVVIAWMIINK